MGYGATYTTITDEVIGTIPVGYADGWTEIYKVSMLLWMDSFVYYLSVCLWTRFTVHLLRFIPRNSVTLMGENGGASITATEVAEK